MDNGAATSYEIGKLQPARGGMAKAHITAPDGTQVKLDGTPEEIGAVLERMKSKSAGTKSASKHAAAKPTARRPGRTSIATLVAELKQEVFFKKPKTLGEIQERLADLGHHYPLTSLSGRMQEQCKKRNLRRFKKDKKYVYAQ